MENKNMPDKKEHIRKLLAEFLGIEPEEIDDEDSLLDDLHIETVSLSDFVKILEEEGFDISRLDLSEADTFLDLVENVNSTDYIE